MAPAALTTVALTGATAFTRMVSSPRCARWNISSGTRPRAATPPRSPLQPPPASPDTRSSLVLSQESLLAMHSCIYNGWVRHRRYEPAGHQFRYELFMMYLDLAELPQLFDQYW